ISAILDARLEPGHGDSIDRDRAGTVVGFSKGNLSFLSKAHAALHSGSSAQWVDPSLWRHAWPNGPASLFASVWDLRGPCLAPVAACATGLIAAQRGTELIRQGVCDVVLVGAGDSGLDPLVQAAFERMRVLAQVGDDPTRAVRPWDRRRSGFLPGEGAAMLV